MIKERLLLLPEEIEKIKVELINKQQEIEDVKVKMKTWELSEMADIANEIDDKGKPVYSNDAKRQAELQIRKDSSDQYQIYSQNYLVLESKIGLLNIKLDKLFNEQGNLRAICRLEGIANE